MGRRLAGTLTPLPAVVAEAPLSPKNIGAIEKLQRKLLACIKVYLRGDVS